LGALTVLVEHDAYPAVFHCSAGKDRTGILAAIVLGLLGVPDDVIVADYTLSAAAMERMIAYFRAEKPDRAEALESYAPALVEPALGQRRDDRGIELVSRIAPRRADVHLALGVPIQQRGRHLTAAGIVHAHEQDLGHLVAHVTTSSSTTCGTTTWRAESRTRGYS